MEKIKNIDDLGNDLLRTYEDFTNGKITRTQAITKARLANTILATHILSGHRKKIET